MGIRNIAAVTLLLCSIQMPAVAETAPADVPHIEVRGAASVRSAPDLIELAISVVSEDQDAQRALANNTARVAAIRKALRAIGLSDGELHTGQFQLQPQWSQPPREPNPQWRPAILGFVVEHLLQVRTKQLTLAGRILSTASDAGANRLGDLQFSLADPAPQRAEAIRQATRNAIADARNIASAAGVGVGAMLAITLEGDTSIEPRQRFTAVRRMSADAAASAPVSIEPGAIDTRAAVLLRVAIAR